MKKVILSGLIASVLLVGAFGVINQVRATDLSVKDLINLLISIGVIAPDKIPAANNYLATLNTGTKIKIALLSMPAKDSDLARVQGCDLVTMVEKNIAPTTMPLTASMNELFSRKDTWPYSESSSGNFISSQQNLFFDHATVENTVAKIYLKGSYSLAGVCDDPRIETQIRNTALQFSTVKSVQIFLNNQAFKIPSGRGY